MTLVFPGKHGRDLTFNDYPLRSLPRQGLHLTFNRNKQIHYKDICTSPSFLVHSPFELPGSYELEELTEFGYGFHFEVLITPEIILADESLKSYEPEKRGCYFEGEKQLKYFKIYTRRNCELECLAENLFHSPFLNCTPYYMPRSDSIEYCDNRFAYWVQFQTFMDRNFDKSSSKCACLDACDFIKYKTEVTAHPILWENEDAYAIKECSFEFKFKEVDVVPLRRYQSFTFTEFLAQSGGFMGLFAGISALSIIEMLYFMTLRFVVNLWRLFKSE
jgi:acid-sensing ion channel, other